MTADRTENADTWMPFLLEMEDMARILRVTNSTISRMLNDGRWPDEQVPPLRMGDRIIRFKRFDVEAFFGAPLSVLAPWLQAPKETA
jgi:predicted DNA-binding transcriptional regulator AlpA